MKCLVPILTKQEFKPEFINAILDKADDLVLLAVIDKTDLAGKFGFAATEIMQANKIMEGIEAELTKLKVKVEGIVEWGSTVIKIDHTCRLKKCETIFLQKQEGKSFAELLKELEKIKEKKVKIEVL
ncbi:MAG: hypothetical protein Q7R70_00445 [Candidatus Diapherotrites archaeon]|nr:hypothetical protein [Candidatus Diapherotrites archaeon]